MKKNLLLPVVILALVSCATPQTPVDPFLAAGQAQATAQAAQQQANYYGAQLTGTAYAPIMAITLTAAEVSLEGTRAASTETAAIKTQSAEQTATATMWTLTPSMTPTPNATTTLVFAESNAETTKIALDVQSKQNTSNFYSAIFPFFLLAALLALAYLGITLSRHYRFKPMARDQRGLSPLLIDVVDGVITDMDANPNYSTSKLLPVVTVERQFTQRMMQAEIISRLPQAVAVKPQKQIQQPPAPLPRIETPRQPFLKNEVAEMQENVKPLPAWEMFRNYQWDTASALPCGVNAHTGTLELWDYSKLPHLSVFGMTGSGKSRRFLRPLVASILASNNRVILLGKETDFQPFMDHPNALVIPVYELTEREEALKYAYALEQCVKEQNRRARHLVEVRASTWQRAGYESTFIVLDEIGNALRQMPKDVALVSFNHVVSLVNEGRKVGFNVVFSSQRPKSFIDLTTQCGQAVFLVRNDRESGYALGQPGAERLREGYFFARFGDLKLAGAFQPDDEQITDLLETVDVTPLEKPNWIEGVVKEVKQEPPLIIPTDKPVVVDETDRIKALHTLGKTESEIIREIWKVSGGGSFYRRRDQVRSVLGVTSSSSSSPAEIHVNG